MTERTLSVADTSLETLHIVRPEHTNPLGVLFGGRMLNWLISAGTLSAARLSRGSVVLGSMDQIDFVSPVANGAVVSIHARVEYVGRCSLEVSTTVHTEDTTTGQSRFTTLAYLSYVAVDADGNPRPAGAKIVPAGDAEEEACYEALKRRRARRARVADGGEKRERGPVSVGAESYRVVFPEHAYLGRNMFAGHLMAFIDEAGSILAHRQARGLTVTASIEGMNFRRPIRVGSTLKFATGLNQTGRSSLEVGVRVTSEEPETGDETYHCSAYLVFVALDEKGKPRPVKPYAPATDYDRDREAKAAERKLFRQKRLASLKRLGL